MPMDHDLDPALLETDDATQVESDRDRPPARTAAEPAAVEELWLLGQPSLENYLGFVESYVVGGAAIPPYRLCAEWRAANDHYARLEEREAGLADRVECRPLPKQLAPLVAEVEADPRFRHTFHYLPTRFAMVELDKLVVYQSSLTRSWAERIAARLGPDADPETVFRTCYPIEADPPPLKIEAAEDDRFLFSSPAHHIAFHEAVLLRPEQVPSYASFGPVGGIVGLVVGFRGNFLNCIKAEDRILLNNGYHRAYALRSLGYTHVPCAIQEVTRLDELRLRATERVADDPAFYFRSARPPLLKDFFDPKLAKPLAMRPRRKLVEVSFQIRKTYLVE